MHVINYRNRTRGKKWDNLTSEEKVKFLEDVLGPKRKYGRKKVLIPTIFYSTISILGIPGNILTLLAIVHNAYMKTAPNYFIFNLAIADLITLLLGKLFYVINTLNVS